MSAPSSEDLYLDLLKRTLTRAVHEENERIVGRRWSAANPGHLPRLQKLIAQLLSRRQYELVRRLPYDAKRRADGTDWPARADTMVGLTRLDCVEQCIRTIIADDVPGDVIETGVWRGGTVIFMRGVLAALGDESRNVWVADSFRGLPRPNVDEFPADEGDPYWQFDELAVSVEQVRHNFERYGLLDDRVRFLVGFFKDTLPSAPIDRLALLRLDGDMYESTMQALQPLYPKLSKGGYVIVDDYFAVPGCKAAVDDYRRDLGIDEPLVQVDWTSVYWRVDSPR